MARPILFVLGAIPVVIALLISIPLILQPDIPFSASTSFDKIEIEYTKYQLQVISHGITSRTASLATEVLLIKDDGTLRYSVTRGDTFEPILRDSISDGKLRKLSALIKETGFIHIPSESFPVRDDILQYQKSSVKATLNGVVNQIHWPQQNSTEKFIPPIITAVAAELDGIISDLNQE